MTFTAPAPVSGASFSGATFEDLRTFSGGILGMSRLPLCYVGTELLQGWLANVLHGQKAACGHPVGDDRGRVVFPRVDLDAGDLRGRVFNLQGRLKKTASGRSVRVVQ